jgi:hypothetical protein
MKISVINKLKEYYDFNKLEGVYRGDEIVSPHSTDIALIESHLSDGESAKCYEVMKKFSDANWKFLEVIFELPVFHIIYFENKSELFSKGMNVYAIDMMSAVERFESETGFEAYICTRKNR